MSSACCSFSLETLNAKTVKSLQVTFDAELRGSPGTEEDLLEPERRLQTLAYFRAPGEQLSCSFRKELCTQPLLVPFRRSRPEDRLTTAVRHTLLGAMIRPASPNHFSQNFEFFNDKDQICSEHVCYKSGRRKIHQGRSGRLEVVALQSRRQPATAFELHEISQVFVVLPRFAPGRMASGD